jgi:hypothetical protein
MPELATGGGKKSWGGLRTRERNPGEGKGREKKSRSGQKKRKENSGAVQQGKKTPRASWSGVRQILQVSGNMAPHTLLLPGSDLM